MPNTNENRYDTWPALELSSPRKDIINFLLLLEEEDTAILDVTFYAKDGGPAPWCGTVVRNRALTTACTDLPVVAIVAKAASGSSHVDGNGISNANGAAFHIFPGVPQKSRARLYQQLEVYKRIKTIGGRLQKVDDKGWKRRLTVDQPISEGTISISHPRTSKSFTFHALAFEARGLHCNAAHILTPTSPPPDAVDPDWPSNVWHLNNGHLSLVKEFLTRCRQVGVCAGKLPHCMVVLDDVTGQVYLRGLPNAVILSPLDDPRLDTESVSPIAGAEAGLDETLTDITRSICKRTNDLLGAPTLPKSTLVATPSRKQTLKVPPKPSFAQTERTSRTVEPGRPKPRPYIPQRGPPLLHPILHAALAVPSDRIRYVQPAESLERTAQFRSATPRVHWTSPQLENDSWAARAMYLRT
ncbi:hypothetical protein FA95DRAFT_1618691 [Auriscalpium vulgare]|uniref:Uncharacterized protein n=1 Tax=Auriscalpium vulgare TaxID=40419 RepID=A0ACB8S731_9AGAM|nr:hypothetical protein FA95DRAFT_1618691 [Auriscalpium vulgare]